MDHDAIRKAYPNVNLIDDELGAFDKDDKKVTLDQSKIDAARVELDKLLYQYDRQRAYPDIGTQLDYIYHNGIDKWKTDIVDPVKQKYPKPE
jgi:hypothetical protein|tara:strand:- start:10 stop:285 length:276 start_codon:yes stop_codon:yes gene_type:complete